MNTYKGMGNGFHSFIVSSSSAIAPGSYVSDPAIYTYDDVNYIELHSDCSPDVEKYKKEHPVIEEREHILYKTIKNLLNI